MMNVLVIGSKGFIGTYLVKCFKDNGHAVWEADIVNKTDEKYTKLDPLNPDFDNLFSKTNVSWCINASGSANVQTSFKEVVFDYRLNTLNVNRILQALNKHVPNCKFINFSSAAIYGSPKQLPVSELQGKNSIPLSPYGWHKLYSEEIVRRFNKSYKQPTCSLRVFSVYGIGQQKLILWDIYNKVKNAKNDNIEMFGSGNETRDFINVLDLVNAIELIFNKGVFDGGAYNVASGNEVTIQEVTRLALENLNPNFSASFSGKSKIGDPLYWKADISKLSALGFENKIPLELGVTEYYKWINETHNS